MTKFEVLKIFSETNGSVPPDQVRVRLKRCPDRRSVYSYLLRLARQGLLKRGHTPWGGLVYQITERGQARLRYFRVQSQ